jgi:hypothetical protein
MKLVSSWVSSRFVFSVGEYTGNRYSVPLDTITNWQMTAAKGPNVTRHTAHFEHMHAFNNIEGDVTLANVIHAKCMHASLCTEGCGCGRGWGVGVLQTALGARGGEGRRWVVVKSGGILPFFFLHQREGRGRLVSRATSKRDEHARLQLGEPPCLG